jgi:hypothetical protein
MDCSRGQLVLHRREVPDLHRALRSRDYALDAALALVDSVLAEVADDVEPPLRSRADILVDSGDVAGARTAPEQVLMIDASDARALIDLADLERDPAQAQALYEHAIALLERRGCPGDADLAAARRRRERCLEEQRRRR